MKTLKERDEVSVEEILNVDADIMYEEEEPTKESKMSNVIDLEVKKLTWISKLLSSDECDETQEVLEAMSMKQIRDEHDRCFPLTIKSKHSLPSGGCVTKFTVIEPKKVA